MGDGVIGGTSGDAEKILVRHLDTGCTLNVQFECERQYYQLNGLNGG